MLTSAPVVIVGLTPADQLFFSRLFSQSEWFAEMLAGDAVGCA
jgi:hypothetical protein